MPDPENLPDLMPKVEHHTLWPERSNCFQDDPADYLASDCQSPNLCDAGKYWVKSVCVACPGGYYQSETAKSSCVQCAPGKYGFKATKECTECDPGHYATTGFKKCAGCPGGYYNNVQGAAICRRCSTGKSNGPGGTSCHWNCVDGLTSSGGPCDGASGLTKTKDAAQWETFECQDTWHGNPATFTPRHTDTIPVLHKGEVLVHQGNGIGTFSTQKPGSGGQGPSQEECARSGLEELPSKNYFHGNESRYFIARRSSFPVGPTEGQYINFDGTPIPGHYDPTINSETGDYTNVDGPYNTPGTHDGKAYNYRGRYMETTTNVVESGTQEWRDETGEKPNELLAESVYQRRQP